MPDKLFSTFGAYDFFGKSIPGAITILLFVGLLPVEPGIFVPSGGGSSVGTAVGTSPSLSFSFIVAGLVVLFVFGFVTGQGVHTIAVLTEKALFVAGERVLAGYHRTPLPRADFFTAERTSVASSDDGRAVRNRLRAVAYGISYEARRLFWRVYIRTKRVFKPHRQIFVRKCIARAGPAASLVAQHCEEKYGLDITDPEEARKAYPLVLSYVDTQRTARSGRFQASFTFCRSIWVVILLFATWYVVADLVTVPFFTGFYGTDPLIRQLFPEDLSIAALAFGALAVPFMYASSAYKDYFIEYAFADFVNACATSGAKAPAPSTGGPDAQALGGDDRGARTPTRDHSDGRAPGSDGSDEHGQPGSD